jgi:hypothetical protein
MKEIPVSDAYSKVHKRRFRKTLQFMDALDLKSSNILNLGPGNPLSEILSKNGYKITNTPVGQDLDIDFDIVKRKEFDVVVGFEILEHLVSPFPLLRAIAAKKLVVSVPMRLWFASAYWNENDPYDRHYHEFEPRQLQMLLNKAGWDIVREKKFTNPSYKPGIRPLLRIITPRYYLVYCERKSD